MADEHISNEAVIKPEAHPMACVTRKEYFAPGSASSSLKPDCFGAPANPGFREGGRGVESRPARRMELRSGGDDRAPTVDRRAAVESGPSSGAIVRRKTGVFGALWRSPRVFATGQAPLPGEEGLGGKLKRLARRVADALAGRRHRQVDREIARLLAQSGGRITDSMEREIMRKVFGSDWSLPD